MPAPIGAQAPDIAKTRQAGECKFRRQRVTLRHNTYIVPQRGAYAGRVERPLRHESRKLKDFQWPRSSRLREAFVTTESSWLPIQGGLSLGIVLIVPILCPTRGGWIPKPLRYPCGYRLTGSANQAPSRAGTWRVLPRQPSWNPSARHRIDLAQLGP